MARENAERPATVDAVNGPQTFDQLGGKVDRKNTLLDDFVQAARVRRLVVEHKLTLTHANVIAPLCWDCR